MSEVQEPICAKCNEKITEGSFVVAGEKQFHSEHFTCSSCQTGLSQLPYEQVGDDYYCATCYENNIAKKCASCGKGIVGNSVALAEGVELHQECFVCFKCKKQLDSEYTQDNDQHIVCYECVENDADKCCVCDKPILDCKITTNQKTYHKECFKCSRCNNLIEEETYEDQEDGTLVHRKCLNLVCAFCQTSIVSEYYKYKDLLYHSECVEKAKAQMLEEENSTTKVEENNNKEEEVKQEVQVPQNNTVSENASDQQKEDEEEKALLKRKQEEEEELQQKKLEQLKLEEEEKQRKVELEQKKQKQKLEEEQEAAKKKIQQQQAERKRLEEEEIKTQNEKQAQLQQQQQQQQQPKQAHNDLSTNETSATYRVIPYDALITNPPADVDVTKKEAYLSDEEFSKLFSMSRADFGALKAWRQKELKQKVKLF